MHAFSPSLDGRSFDGITANGGVFGIMLAALLFIAFVVAALIRGGMWPRVGPAPGWARLAATAGRAWSVAVVSSVLFAVPAGSGTTETIHGVTVPAGAGSTSFSHTYGVTGVLLLLAPALLSFVPLLGGRRVQRVRLMVACGLLQLVFAVGGALSVGLWFIPGAFAMIAAAALDSGTANEGERDA